MESRFLELCRNLEWGGEIGPWTLRTDEIGEITRSQLAWFNGPTI
jgi:hypothetical protein